MTSSSHIRITLVFVALRLIGAGGARELPAGVLVSNGYNHVQAVKCRGNELGRIAFQYGDNGKASTCGDLCAGWGATPGMGECRAFVFEPFHRETEPQSGDRMYRGLCKFYGPGECSPKRGSSRTHLFLAEEPEGPSNITFSVDGYAHKPHRQCEEANVSVHYLSERVNISAAACAEACRTSDAGSDGEPCSAFVFQPFYSKENGVTGLTEYLPRCKLYSECTLAAGPSTMHAYISEAAAAGLMERTTVEERAYFRGYASSFGSLCEESAEWQRVDCVQHCAALCYQVMGVGPKRCSAFAYNVKTRMCKIHTGECTPRAAKGNWLYRACEAPFAKLHAACIDSDWSQDLPQISETGRWEMSYRKQTMEFQPNRCPARGYSRQVRDGVLLKEQGRISFASR